MLREVKGTLTSTCNQGLLKITAKLKQAIPTNQPTTNNIKNFTASTSIPSSSYTALTLVLLQLTLGSYRQQMSRLFHSL